MLVARSGTTWKRHIYADSSGEYPATLNKWETAVISYEFARDKSALWLRNIPRKPWAVTVPYEVSGKPAAFFPDFIFLRNRNGEWMVDILDPHHIDLADAPAKAVGLAKYAAKHHSIFNRIELIIVRGEDDIRRINLADEYQREKVLAVKTKEHLSLLFEEITTAAHDSD
jgi:type III restriction enzyme